MLNLIFVVRPIARRTERAKLIMVSEETDIVRSFVKGWKMPFDIPKKYTRKGLKTASYIPSMDVGNTSDIAIIKYFDELQDIQKRLGIGEIDFKNVMRSAKSRFSHLLVSRRFNFAAPGTRALAFFSQEKLLASKAFWVLSLDIDDSKIMCLWLNSTFSFIESLLLQTETEGSFIELTKDQLLKFHFPNTSTCDTTILLEAFEKVRHAELPPLFEQFENPPEARKIIDRAVLKFIGYSEKQIDALLPELYMAMATELKSWRDLMHKSSSKNIQPSLQMHLLPTE